MNVNFLKAISAGIVGTAVMTMVGVYVAPMMGIPKMNPAEMLAAQMGGNIVLGWAGHVMVGIVLAVLYAFVSRALPGPTPVRGALFGIAPWLFAQTVVIPMMGMPFFSGSVALALGSLVGHLMYGAVVGIVYGTPAPAWRTAAA